MHLMGMGYKYISQRGLFTKYVTIPKTESDTLTNILLQPFSEAYLRLNPLSTQDDADAMLHRIQKSLNNDDLGRQFYKEILLDTTNKILIYPGDDVRGMITPAVGVIRHALDAGVWQWHGYTAESRVKQVRTLLSHYFHYHEDSIHPAELDLMIEDLLFVHKA